ncbi:MAG TPA: addiction module protein [Longimicrobiaceae bacterium]
MTIPLDQLEKELLQLPRDVRARLADVLAESVEKEVAAAWDEEIGRRLDAYERGELKTIPAEEVLAELRARLQK